MKRRLGVVAAAVSAVLTLSGCGFQGLYSVPLPGGADLGDHPFTVTAEFRDVLDLVPQSSVKVDNVPVGRVTAIDLGDGGRTAVVTMRINGDVDLPANATASIQQTSLLGEKFVDLGRPSSDPTGVLADHSRIGVASTTQGVEVEQVFGALSLLLNGGGLEQIQTITRELNAATDGKSAQYRSFLSQLDQTIGQLDQRKTSITRALDAVNGLAVNLKANTTQIQNVLDNLSPGLQILADERDQFVTMLGALNRLSGVTVDTLAASKDDIVADLNSLAPILSQLAAAGSALPDSLQVLLTYPFPDSVLAAIKGDYVNGFIVTNFSTKGTIPVGGAAAVGGSSSSGTPTFGTTSVTPPPSLLPPTSSATLGVPTSTITTDGPTASGTPSGTASGSPSGSASGTATGTPSGSGSGTPSGSGSGTPSGSGSGSASGTPSGSASGTPSGTGGGR